MATKAIHLEKVSDCTTKTFLQAFDRFTSSRCTILHPYSVIVPTFQGAINELQRLFDATLGISQEIADVVSNSCVEWSFIPPRGPLFG